MRARYIHEELGFERTGDVKKGLGIGEKAIFDKIERELGPLTFGIDAKMIYEQLDELIQKYGFNRVSKFFKERYADKFISLPSKEQYHVHPLVFSVLNKLNLLEYVIEKNPTILTKFYFPDEIVLKYIENPNRIFSIGVNFHDYDLIREGIKRGATNLDIGMNKAIRMAADDGKTYIVKELLKHPGVDPGTGTPEGRRYNRDESNFPIRRAAAKGYLDIVKLLIKDPRVDPSAKKNFALKHAWNNRHFDIVDILLKDKRVINSIDEMPKKHQKEIIEYAGKRNFI